MASEAEDMQEFGDDEVDDGPPPGFDNLSLEPKLPPRNSSQLDGAEAEVDDGDDGPPPGFDRITAKPLPSTPPMDVKVRNGEEIEDEEDGPPPGYEFNVPSELLPPQPAPSSKLLPGIEFGKNKEQVEDNDDDGPPPGWEMMSCQRMQHSSTLPVPSSIISPDRGMGSKQVDVINKEERSPSSKSTAMQEQSMAQILPLQPPPSSAHHADIGTGSKQGIAKDAEKRSPPTSQSMPPTEPLPPRPLPTSATSSAEMGQVVCGSCRHLLAYPRGVKYVECPLCKTVNLVFEADQIGHVKCGGCSVLLMYQYGSPAVRCSSCRFVTEIGVHNRRPPLSALQARARCPSKHR